MDGNENHAWPGFERCRATAGACCPRTNARGVAVSFDPAAPSQGDPIQVTLTNNGTTNMQALIADSQGKAGVAHTAGLHLAICPGL